MITAVPDPTVQETETVFTVAASSLKFGAGSLAELGSDAARLGMRRAALFTDKHVADIEPVFRAQASLRAAGIDVAMFDEVRVEPTDQSFKEAAAFAHDAAVDGFISIGGGSVIDTAKAANLLISHAEDFLTFVNAPIGGGKPVPGPCRPHIACPTTCGTGSECTGVAICDIVALQVKTGVSSPHLKPSLAVVDPTTTHSLPRGVVAATGFDVLTHAIESYTAKPFGERPKAPDPAGRPVYQGANPWSDIGSAQAIRLGGRYLQRAVADAADREARHGLMFAATLAGMAFGNAGVHIPHAMSYGVAGLRHDFRARGYESEAPGVPHGISVVVNAPATFRFTAAVAPLRHLEAADWLGADVDDALPDDAGRLLADRLIAMMRDTGIPNGVGGVGYGPADIPALVKGAVAQQRLLVNAPRPVGDADLAALFRDALAYW